jgi:hypothetical protein
MLMYSESVTPELLEVLRTAISLQMGHRLSIDIDLFCNEKVNKQRVVAALQADFIDTQVTTTNDGIKAFIKDIKIDIYDDWSIPFKKPVITANGIRLSDLEDLASFKLTAFTERREKKDYIDLYFLFKKFGGIKLLERYKSYNPLLSPKSILFALEEVDTAISNKSVMPKMLVPFSWEIAKESFHLLADEYLHFLQNQRRFGN